MPAQTVVFVEFDDDVSSSFRADKIDASGFSSALISIKVRAVTSGAGKVIIQNQARPTAPWFSCLESDNLTSAGDHFVMVHPGSVPAITGSHNTTPAPFLGEHFTVYWESTSAVGFEVQVIGHFIEK